MEAAGAQEEKLTGDRKAETVAAESLTESRRALFGGLRGNGNRSSQKLSEGIDGESGTLDRESRVSEHGGRSDSRVRTGIQSDSEADGFEGRGAGGRQLQVAMEIAGQESRAKIRD